MKKSSNMVGENMQKRFIKIILFLFIINILTISRVSAASNPYKQTGPYGTNCTWYAWQMAYEKAGIALPGWGNAKQWYNDAKNAGYSVGTTPKAGSIIVWGGWTSYGHVGYVEKVSGNTLYVWDSTGPCIDKNDSTYQECLKNSWNEDTDRACKENAPKVACEYTISPDEYGITGYIYLNTAPKKQTTSTYNSEPKTQVVVKSNNANLKAIELSTGKLEFAKDVLEYKINVENKINTITVNATSEDSKAKVEGNGEYELKAGANEIKLTVTAEDGTTKEYKINVVRDIKEKVSRKKLKTNYTNLIIIILIDIVIILITVITLIIINKKRHPKANNQKAAKTTSNHLK